MAHLHPIVLARSSCPDCFFVFPALQTDSAALCPRCSGSGVKMLWPDISTLKLYEMTLYFAALADGKVSDARQQLARTVSGLLGRDVDDVLLTTTALEAQAIYEHAPEADRWTQALFDEILHVIQSRVGPASEHETTQLWGFFGSYSEATDESQVAAILACTFLERLLGDVLTVLGITTGMSHTKAERTVNDDLQSIKARDTFFAQHAHVSLETAFLAIGYQAFWDDWKAIRQRRNDFIHGQPWAIGAETALVAIATAKQAAPALARLQNAYCINSPC